MTEDSLRRHLVQLLESRNAHVDFEAAIEGLAPELRGKKHPDLPHTAWQLLEHLRIAQWDILEFSRSQDHISPDWPEGYWPASETPPSEQAWDDSVAEFRGHLQDLIAMAEDEQVDLFAEIPWGNGQTVLRELLLVADHNAYHVGQIVQLRRALGVWNGGPVEVG